MDISFTPIKKAGPIRGPAVKWELVLPAIDRVETFAVIVQLVSTNVAMLCQKCSADITSSVVASWPIDVSLVLAEAEVFAASRSINAIYKVVDNMRRTVLMRLVLLDNEFDRIGVWLQLDVVLLWRHEFLGEIIHQIIKTKPSLLDGYHFDSVVLGMIVL